MGFPLIDAGENPKGDAGAVGGTANHMRRDGCGKQKKSDDRAFFRSLDHINIKRVSVQNLG